MSPPSTLRPQEKAFYNAQSCHWWDEKGPFRQLHLMNPARLRYVRNILTHEGTLLEKAPLFKGLSGLRGVDVGCGGGIATEPLARMGAQMVGLDASDEAISVASQRAAAQGLTISYKEETIETFAEEIEQQVDFITAFEILEHVAEHHVFFAAVKKILRPGGVFIFSTLNRTLASYVAAIGIGEYVLNLVPRGTHQWECFLKPSEIAAFMRQSDITFKEVKGMRPTIKGDWCDTDFLGVNYLGYGIV